jgi:hypothetical protein
MGEALAVKEDHIGEGFESFKGLKENRPLAKGQEAGDIRKRERTRCGDALDLTKGLVFKDNDARKTGSRPYIQGQIRPRDGTHISDIILEDDPGGQLGLKGDRFSRGKVPTVQRREEH